MDTADLYRSLRYYLERERDFGIEFTLKPVAEEVSATGSSLPSQEHVSENSTAHAVEQPAEQTKTKIPAATAAELVPSASATENLKRINDAIEQAGSIFPNSNKAVPGAGNSEADLMFIGDVPGYEEDSSGQPFVGPAGQLLSKMIKAMGFEREDIFLTNVMKWRTPNGRPPREEEARRDAIFLKQQISVIQPRIICCLGETSLRLMCNDFNAQLAQQHGQQFTSQFNETDTSCIATFHPAFLLRNEEKKRECWSDLKKIMAFLAN